MSLILAIDLGKDNSVFCEFDPAGGEVEFRTARSTLDSSRAELTQRAARVQRDAPRASRLRLAGTRARTGIGTGRRSPESEYLSVAVVDDDGRRREMAFAPNEVRSPKERKPNSRFGEPGQNFILLLDGGNLIPVRRLMPVGAEPC